LIYTIRVLIKRRVETREHVVEEESNLVKAPRVPPSLPFFGSMEYFGGPYNFLKANAKKYGEIYSFVLLGQQVFFLGTTKPARDLFFKSEPAVFSFYDGYKELFGAIIGKELFSDHNKEFSHLLHVNNIKMYIDDVIKATPSHLNSLWGDKGKVDLFHTAYKAVFKMTLRVMCCKEVADDHFEEFSQCYHILDSEFSAVSLFAPWFPNITQIKRYYARNKIFKLLDDVVEKRIQNPDDYGKDSISKIIDYYRKADGIVNKEHIKYFIMASMFAAQTNTALAGGWSLLYIISNREHWDTAMQEIKAAIAKHGKISYEALEEMKFLEKCILESLRLTISSGGWWRKAMVDLDVRGTIIPEGSLIVNNPALYHLNDTYFENAFTFNPNRDLSENSNIAFGSGLHPCLGKKVAVLEVKTFLVTALTNYVITPPSEKVPEVNRNTMHGSWPMTLPFIEVERVL